MRHNTDKPLQTEAPAKDSGDSLGTPSIPLYSSKEDYWQQCKDYLQRHIPDSLYKTMIATLDTKTSTHSESSQLEIFAPSQQIANRISQRYFPMIQDFLKKTSFKGQVSLAVRQKKDCFHQQKEKEQIIKTEASFTKIKTLEQKKTGSIRKFAPKLLSELLLDKENFCISEINQKQIEQLWQQRGAVSYIYGAEGSGKSTIGRALAQQKERLGMRTRMLRFQNFVAELAVVARNRDSTSWNKTLRTYDCLIIDDFQYIKPQALRSQEELSYLVDEFIQKDKLLLFCADRPAQKLPLTPSLLSRLQAGRIIQLTYPNQQERQNILQKEAKNQGIALKRELTCYLSTSICKDMRRLKTAVKRLHELYMDTAPTEQKGVCIDFALLDRLCGDLYSISPQIGYDDILRAVAKFYNINPESIRGPARDKKYSAARHLVAYLCTHHLKINQTETARLIGRRDHTSVVYARNKIAKLMETDLFFRRQIQELCRELSL